MKFRKNRYHCGKKERQIRPLNRCLFQNSHMLYPYFKEVLRTSRRDSQKAIFLVTDGFSNGGDPRSEAKYLRDIGVKIFTFGIRNGNVRELHDMASDPKNETCYILDTFEEFEALARRALHEGTSVVLFYCRFKYSRRRINL